MAEDEDMGALRGDRWRARGRRIVFICGLHRSGTSLLHTCLRTHPGISGFTGTGVCEDEGQHLQTVMSPAKEHGGPGRFAFDPSAHLTETSATNPQETAQQLFEQWSPYWDLNKPLLLEKSPPNLLRTRYLQSLFPEACFVVVTRHPIVTSLAESRRRGYQLHSLLRHWFRAHELLGADLRYVQNVLVIRYEDLCHNSSTTLANVAKFLCIEDRFQPPAIDPSVDKRYKEAWDRWRARPYHGVSARLLATRYERRARAFGYSMKRLPSNLV